MRVAVRVSIGLLLAVAGGVAWNYGCDRVTADVTDMQQQVAVRHLAALDLHVARFDQIADGRRWVWRARMANRAGSMVTSVNEGPSQMRVGDHFTAYRIGRGRYFFPQIDTVVPTWFRVTGSSVACLLATTFVLPRRGRRRHLEAVGHARPRSPGVVG